MLSVLTMSKYKYKWHQLRARSGLKNGKGRDSSTNSHTFQSGELTKKIDTLVLCKL